MGMDLDKTLEPIHLLLSRGYVSTCVHLIKTKEYSFDIQTAVGARHLLISNKLIVDKIRSFFDSNIIKTDDISIFEATDVQRSKILLQCIDFYLDKYPLDDRSCIYISALACLHRLAPIPTDLSDTIEIELYILISLFNEDFDDINSLCGGNFDTAIESLSYLFHPEFECVINSGLRSLPKKIPLLLGATALRKWTLVRQLIDANANVKFNAGGVPYLQWAIEFNADDDIISRLKR